MATASTSSSTDTGIQDPDAAAPASATPDQPSAAVPEGAVQPVAHGTTEPVGTGEHAGKGLLLATFPMQSEFVVTAGRKVTQSGPNKGNESDAGTTYLLTPAGTPVAAEHLDEVRDTAAAHRVDLRTLKVKTEA